MDKNDKKKLFIICYKEQYDMIYDNYRRIFRRDLNEYEVVLPYKFHNEKKINESIEKAIDNNFSKSLREMNIKKKITDEAIDTVNNIIKYNAHKETIKEWAYRKEQYSREQIEKADKCVIIYSDDDTLNKVDYKNYSSLKEYKREIEYAKRLNKKLRASTIKKIDKTKILRPVA